MLTILMSLAMAGRLPDVGELPSVVAESEIATKQIEMWMDEARADQRHYLATCREERLLSARAHLELLRTAATNAKYLAEGDQRDDEVRLAVDISDRIEDIRDGARQCPPPAPRPWMPDDPDEDIFGMRGPVRAPVEGGRDWQPTGQTTPLLVPQRG